MPERLAIAVEGGDIVSRVGGDHLHLVVAVDVGNDDRPLLAITIKAITI